MKKKTDNSTRKAKNLKAKNYSQNSDNSLDKKKIKLSLIDKHFIELNSSLKLKIELIPRTSWGKNLRSILPNNKWEEIRKKVIKNAGNKCEICGQRGNENILHCHEEWTFNDDTLIQKLENLISICQRCHSVKHIGRSLKIKKDPEVINHFKKINKINSFAAINILNSVLKQWLIRSNKNWEIDISYLKKFNIPQ